MTAALPGFPLRRQRVAVLAALGAIVAASWAYLLLGAGMGMAEMDMGGGETMLMRPEWTPAYLMLVLAMWSVMMAAMMLPSAVPAVLDAVDLALRSREALWAALIFVIGYLAIWVGFALVATGLQWGLDALGLLFDNMAIHDTGIAAGLLIAVGLYQLTPWKQHFLRHCSATTECARAGGRMVAANVLGQGARYGISCLGCCAALMALMFVGGPMSALWMAAIALWVLAEKSLRFGGHLARAAGIGLIACGGASLVATGI
jgi:predicted metal-binding membrane protein